MRDRQRTRQAPSGLPISTFLTVSLTALGSTHTAALPLVQDPGSAAVGMILIADQEPTKPETPTQTGDSEKHTPFIELNEELAAARARLEELAKAGAVAAPSRELQWLRAENQRLAAEVAKLRASSDELQTARKGAEERIAEMAKAVEQAAAQAKRIEEVLVAMRWQNRQLNTNLARGQAVREKIEREARDAQEELSAKVETLSNSAEQSAAEITRLHARLDDSQRQLKAAVGSRETAETRLVELKEALQRAENEIIRSDEQLRALRSRFTQAAAERAEDDVRIAELQSRGEQLRAALASAQNDATGSRAASATWKKRSRCSAERRVPPPTPRGRPCSPSRNGSMSLTPLSAKGSSPALS